jgi:Outer membrane protein beta-barrel domain
MKKIITILLFLGLFPSTIFCQNPNVKIGLRAGMTVATYKSDLSNTLITSMENRVFATLGIPIEINFSNRYALQIECNFNQKGYKANAGFTGNQIFFLSEKKLVVNWLDLPILFKVKFQKPNSAQFGLFLGPSISYAVNGKYDYSAVSSLGNTINSGSTTFPLTFDNHARYDVSLNGGGEINYKNFFLDLRYQLGFLTMVKEPFTNDTRNVTTDTPKSAKNQAISLTFGYHFITKNSKKS